MMLQRLRLDYFIDRGRVTLVMGGYGCYVQLSEKTRAGYVPKRKWEVHADGVPHEHLYASGRALRPSASRIQSMQGALQSMAGEHAEDIIRSWWENAVAESGK